MKMLQFYYNMLLIHLFHTVCCNQCNGFPYRSMCHNYFSFLLCPSFYFLFFIFQSPNLFCVFTFSLLPLLSTGIYFKHYMRLIFIYRIVFNCHLLFHESSPYEEPQEMICKINEQSDRVEQSDWKKS